MTKSFFLRLVFHNTFKKRLRALLVIVGIAITSSAMIVLFGVSTGLKNLVDAEVASTDARDVVTVDQRNVQQIRLDPEHVSNVQSISSIGQVETSVALVGNLVHNGIDLNVPVYGVSEGFFAVSPATFASGEGNGLSGTNIIMSTKVLDALGISEADALGAKVTSSVTTTKDQATQQVEEQATSTPEDFTITGVVQKGDLPIAYLPMETLRTYGVDMVSQLKVRVSNPDAIPEVRESIEQMGFQTTSVQDTVEQINKVFSVIQKTLVLFAFIVFGITVAGTFTIITLTLMEEMKQIGFLRISGLRNADVHRMFILQSIILTTLGATVGVVGGLFGGAIVNGLARSASSGEVFSGAVTIFAVPTVQIALVLVLSIGIGWLVGLFPAKRALRVKPLEELMI